MADRADGQPCWCASLPALPAGAIAQLDQDDAAPRCLCPACLRAKLEECGAEHEAIRHQQGRPY
jgi:hypothetical protein